jgi:pimeloyl-ACP methyl ester carboxylesterase
LRRFRSLLLVLGFGVSALVLVFIEIGFRVVTWAPSQLDSIQTLDDLPPSDKRMIEWMGFMRDPTQDFGIPFENVEFRTKDSVRLSGWVLNSQFSACGLIFVHGRGSDRRTFLRHLGWAIETKCRILMFDLRNHGLSQYTTGHTSLGNIEKDDVLGAIKYFDSAGVDDIFLLGTSLGGAAVIFASKESSKIKKVIVENTYSSVDLIFKDFRGPSAEFIRLFPMSESLIGFIKSYSLFRLGLEKFREPIEEVSQFEDKSILYIHGLEDTEILPHHSQLLFQNTSSKNKFLWTPEKGKHSSVFNQNQTEYRLRVLKFLALEESKKNVRTHTNEK